MTISNKNIHKYNQHLTSRYGMGMNGRHLSGTTKTIRGRIFINPVKAPPRKNLVYKLGYWGWQLKYCYLEINGFFTSKAITNRHLKWFKYYSFLKLKEIKWIIQTSCIRYETV